MFSSFMNGASMILKKKKNHGQHQHQHQGQGWGNDQGWGGQGNQGWGGSDQGWGGSNQGWGNDQGWGGQGNQGWGGSGIGLVSPQSQMQWGNNLSGQQWVEEQKRRNDFNIVNPGQGQINLNEIIAQQVVFIEPSPSQKKLEELKRTGRPFIDESFPANQTSLVGEYGPQQDWKDITWKPITSIMKNPTVFHDKPGPNDIKQGYLGDCYFLAGLAALAERPDRIYNLFFFNEMNQQRYFSVKLLYKGKWMTIDMDEYVPCIGNQPAFSRAGFDELWVVLLEKAWAKLYTSYKRIEAGYPQEPLHDLTGAPIKQIVLKGPTFNKEQQWQYLVESSAKEYSMVASSMPGSDRNKSTSGVVQGHAYTVLNAVILNFNGMQERVIQLRNPWGKGEFTGRWSDHDPNWNAVSPQQKQRIGYTQNKEDGVFWMSFDDFIAEFRAITIAEIDDQASYVYKSFKDPQMQGAYFAVDIGKEDLYSFQIDKTPERIYPDQFQQKFQYPEALIQIGRLNGNSCQKYQGLRSARRTLIKKERLPPGRYIVYCKISYDRDFENQFDVNLAVYSSTACTISLASRQQAVIFTGNQNVSWSGEDKTSSQPWNTMGNIESNGNNTFSGIGGNQGGQQGWGSNDGWGGSQGAQQGWGGSQQGSHQTGWESQPNDQGWGVQGGAQHGGWGQGGSNDGWGQGGNNNGWGQGNNGW